MSLEPISLFSSPRFGPPSVHFGTRLWEYPIGRYSMLCVGVVALLALFAIKVYRQSFIKPIKPSSTAPKEAPPTVPLPKGLTQYHVDQALNVFIKQVCLHWDPKRIPKIGLSLSDVIKWCNGLEDYNCLFNYLKEIKIIKFYRLLSCDAYELELAQEYIQNIRNNPATSPKPPSQDKIDACIQYLHAHAQIANVSGITFSPTADGLADFVIPGGAKYAMIALRLTPFTQGCPSHYYFFDYLVDRGLIIRYAIAERSDECYIQFK